MFFLLDAALCLEAIVLWAQAEQLAAGVGWTAVAVCVAVDWALSIPTRPMTNEERDEWMNG